MSLYTLVIPAGKQVSSAMDSELKYFHVVWIPAIPAGMTDLCNNDKGLLPAQKEFVEVTGG